MKKYCPLKFAMASGLDYTSENVMHKYLLCEKKGNVNGGGKMQTLVLLI